MIYSHVDKVSGNVTDEYYTFVCPHCKTRMILEDDFSENRRRDICNCGVEWSIKVLAEGTELENGNRKKLS